jgi:thioredoxin reductase (NADPH)
VEAKSALSSSPDTPPRDGSALPDRLFPTLTPQQASRIAAPGRRRPTARGDVLVEVGDRVIPFFLVVSGAIDAVHSFDGAETLNATIRAGQFTGEASLLSGRRSMAQLRVSEPGEVIELNREQLLALVQTDAELSEILMRAFILRRVELVARDRGDVVVIGSRHNAGTLRVKEFLTRNGHPFHYVDLDQDTAAQDLLDRSQITIDDVPVLICRGSAVLRNPTNSEIADCLGFNAGGQAGSSSRIENYLGFPTGISGLDLTGRAYAQALKFGAQIIVAKGATSLACDGQRYRVQMADGARASARTIIIASGAAYRRPELENLSSFEGAGVYYGATPMEAQLCAGNEVVVVGGGNSAGQAAVFLAQTTARVYMLIRRDGLAETMSRYLIRRIEENPNIVVRTRTQITALEGNGHLERIRWHDDQDWHHGDTQHPACVYDDGRHPEYALA